MNSDRLIMARTHLGQKIPILKAEQALVETGAEYIVPQVTSSKFIQIAKYDGEVINLKPMESITVKYINGRVETFDIQPRFSTTKRNSNIMIDIDSLNEGDKFKKDQMIAWSKMFDGDRFVAGRNTRIAIMNYDGLSFEDSYVISDKMANDFETNTINKITVLIPENTKILKFNSKLYSETKKDDILVEFEYVNDISDYIELYGLNEENPEVDGEEENIIFTKSQNSLKTNSPGGEIVDIKIKINNPTKVDQLLVREWKTLVSELKRKHKELTRNAQSQKEMLSDNLDMSIIKTGVHKFKGNFFEGALVEFYIKSPKVLTNGDKISNRFGAKGTVGHVMSQEETPRAEFSGDIDIFLPSCGVLGRKNSSVIKELYIGKLMYNLKEITKNMANKDRDIESIKKIVFKVYDLLDPTKDKKLLNSIKNKLNSSNINVLKDDSFKFIYMIPPFNIPTFENIKEAAIVLGIQLDERVWIPKYNTWTKVPVPVGYAYYSAMEQFSSDYENTRSEGGYNQKTGQPLRGASRNGGQAVGGLDLFALLTYDANPILEELMVGRSDNIAVKRTMINNLRMNGESNLVKDPRKGQTKLLMNNLFRGLGLDIS